MKAKFKEYGKLLTRYLLPHWPKLIVLFILLAISIGLNLILPQIVRYYIDNLKNNLENKIMLLIAGGYILTVLVRLIISIVNMCISENMGWIASNRLRMDLTLHCINLDMEFHKSHTTGEMIERIDGDVSFLANFLSLFVVNFIGNIVLVVGILVMLLIENWILSCALGILSIAILISLSVLQKLIIPFWAKAREVSATLFGYIEEHLVGKEDICALGVEKFSVDELSERLDDSKQKYRKAAFVSSFASLFALSLFNIGDAVSLGLGAFLYLRGSISLGTVYLIFNYAGLLYRPLEELRREFSNLHMIGASVQRICKLFNTKSSIIDGDETLGKNVPISIEVDNVSFQYRENEMVLNDISFKLECNKILGVIGRTGSGKSTLSQLLLRLYESQKGVIKINGKDIKRYQLEDFRQAVSMITQNVQIFNATVRDNISLFSKDISDEKILLAINKLELGEWFSRLPNGLDTYIKSDGLSTGEAQLLAFTRIFLKNPRLIILDEATSFIDPYTVSLIEKSINKLLQNRTVVIIAHRLKTLSMADNILVLEKGNIREYGRRNDLEKNKNTLYYKLLHMEYMGRLEEMLE